ncbi:MAG: hypothetical protein A3F47_00805 [Candidatus Staskawiczbacteria bacterium RIFCSPHIGHO2_12_FULL_38_11]|uniref:Excinuclease ABC subunit C n=1 Tax=Candidatus Staskawiczbacteria bacterium RIFCSPHIGHO2_12_FULL_38_11 TaxID=1802209 RepID=A0A1G2I6S9_9BACT|nr:MAG: hypothetical protein A3F47_00805 [Candidatus Staskawiczbacteria bacterium RIFCSPHIGHO2_12_FULL_38_11]
MEKFSILPKNRLNNLPKTAGVYCFISRKETIYIGKAINIKDRVKNHFNQPSFRDNLFIEKVEKIGFINTDSEIEALILEANLIKKHQPKFNVIWKDGKNYFYVAITKDKKPVVFITHQPKKVLSSKYQVLSIKRKNIPNTKYSIPNTQYIGPFVEGNALKKTLKYLRKIFPFYTSVKHPKNACTWCHLGLCPGPNPDLASYKKNIQKLKLILEGKRRIVLNNLKREMQAYSKANKFEEAGKIRDRINALQQVMAHTKVIENTKIENGIWYKTQQTLQGMLNLSKEITKIECYDISNIQGKYAVGSMVVFVNGAPNKSQYKKFRIRMKNEPNDIAMLKEVLTRRLLHPEWGYPGVMLIDGGIAQLNVAINAKKEFLEDLTIAKNTRKAENIKIISIAKGKRELLIEGAPKIPLKNLPQEIYNLIVALDDEAHRFAITYHKKVRKKALLDPSP